MKLAWSNLAREELVELRRFSVKRWGRDVTQLYLQDVRAAAKQLCVDPGRAKPVERTIPHPSRAIPLLDRSHRARSRPRYHRPSAPRSEGQRVPPPVIGPGRERFGVG